MHSIDLASVHNADNHPALIFVIIMKFSVKNRKKCVFLYLVLFQCFRSNFSPAWDDIAQNNERNNLDNVPEHGNHNARIKFKGRIKNQIGGSTTYLL